MQKLKEIIASDEMDSEKKRRIKELIEELGENASIGILTNILSNSNIVDHL